MNIYPIWTDSTLEIGAAPEGLSDTMFPAGAKAIGIVWTKPARVEQIMGSHQIELLLIGYSGY